MKIFRIIILVGVLVIHNSCGEDAVDLQPPFPTTNQFYADQDDFTASVFAIYQKLQDFYRYNGGRFTNELYVVPDDNAKSATNNDFNAFNFFANLSTTEGDLNRYYTLAYQLISRSNDLLSRIDAGSDVYEDANLPDVHRAEARFLRGLIFYRLWHFFGTAPVVTSVFNNVGEAVATTNSTGNELLDAAIEDFTFAKANLPASWPANYMGRATSGAATGFLGKVLFTRGYVSGTAADMTAAITEFNSITGYSLVNDFGSNFDEGFENNAESLFEVQFSANEITLNIWLSVEGFPANGDTGGYWGLFDGTVNFGSTVVATADAIGAFEVGDPRIAESFDPATGEIFKYVNRASYSGNLVPGTPHVFNNARALRYADILLMQAWAIVETGGTLSDAIALVNQVRTRARDFGGVGNTIPADHPTTETDVNTVRDWVLNERRVELAFEESHRWFDLRLLHLTNQIDLTTYDFGDAAFADSYDFDAFEIYFPFPDQEVETTALNQNTGYN